MLDTLGRDVGEINLNVQAIKTQMLQDIGKSAKPNGADQGNQAVLNKIATQLETIVGYKLDDELKKFNKALDTIADGAKELTKNKNKSKQQAKDAARAMGSDPTARAALSLLKKIAANQVGVGSGSARPIPGQPRAISSMNSGVNMMGKLFQNMNNFFKRNKSIITGPGGGGGGGRGGGGGGAASAAPGGGNNRRRREETFLQKTNRYGKMAGGAAGSLLTGGNPVETIVSGLGGMLSKGLSAIPVVGGFLSGFLDSILKPLNEELESFRGMTRSLIVNYGTGLVDLNKKLEEFKITDDAILVTGQSRSVLLKEQQKFYKRGIGDAKAINKVMHVGLQTATLIDSDASSTADMFADWSQHLGASEHQLNMMSRGMVGIGRQTGLTGANLLQVAKSSEDFMKNMRLAGTFTGSSANNIMGMMAQAQKTGTTAGAGRLLGGLSSGLLGNSTDEKTKSLLMRAGTFGGVDPMKMISGVGTDKASMAGVANGLERIIKQYTGGRDISKLSKQERGIISQIMEADTGFKLEELNLTMKNMREASKSFDQQLADVENKLKKNLLEPEEARAQKEAILFSKADETIENFNGNLEQLNPELKGALDQQVEIMNARLQRTTGGGFNRESGESNETLIARIQRANQQINAAELEAKDPYKKIENSVNAVENAIREELMKILREWLPKIGNFMGEVRNWVLGPGRELFAKIVEWLKQAVGYVFDILKFLSPGTAAAAAAANDPGVIAAQKAVKEQEATTAKLTTGGGVKDLANMSKEELAKKATELAAAIAAKQAQSGALEKAIENEKGYRGGFMGSLYESTGFDPLQWIPGMSDSAATFKNSETEQKKGEAFRAELGKSTDEMLKQQMAVKFAQMIQNAKSPEDKQALEEKIAKYYELQTKFNEANFGDKPGMLPEMMKAYGEIGEMAKKASNPGSIFTHDTHLEKLLEGVPTLVSSMMPGMDVDEEIQKRQIAIDDSNAEIEANTSDTATNTRQTNVLLGTLLNVISRSARRKGADTPIAGEDVDDSVFFDQFIDVDWVDTIGRMVGNTWTQGNPGKHN